MSAPLPSQHELRERVVVDADSGCWVWQRGLNNDGYARTRGHGEVMAHRVVYRVFKGDIPPGHHLYRNGECNRTCVNPDHLTPSLPRGRVTHGR